MKLNLHLLFDGNAAEAFAFYADLFHTGAPMLMTYSQAPEGVPVPAQWGDKVMHVAIPLGGGQLMGCDAPAERRTPMGGFQVSVEFPDQAEVTRVFNALAQGGNIQMPLMPTFWTPLFGMCTDRFGVAWMVGTPGEGQ